MAFAMATLCVIACAFQFVSTKGMVARTGQGAVLMSIRPLIGASSSLAPLALAADQFTTFLLELATPGLWTVY